MIKYVLFIESQLLSEPTEQFPRTITIQRLQYFSALLACGHYKFAVAGHTAPAQICLKNPYLGNCINAEIGYQCLLLTRLAMNAKSLSQTWHLTMGELVLMDLAGEEHSEAFCMAKKGYWLT